MTAFVVATFVLTYVGMALGRVPGFRIDRSGIALLAVAALLASGAIDVANVGRAIDAPTLVLLFALMILSAQFEIAGLYRLAARAITGSAADPGRLLGLTVLVSGGLSALLANDIVVYAMTPLLVHGVRARGLDPRPFLIGLAAGANAGSAATVIGNPQNILIAQVGGLDFWAFFAVCAPPAAAGLAIAWVCTRWLWRRELAARQEPEAAPPPLAADRWQINKGVAATLLLIGLFATDLPREVGGLAIAAVLLVSRSFSSREMIGAVDWHLLVLFACLFTVTAAFADTALAAQGIGWLAQRDLLPDHLAMLAPLALVGSNTVGNVPAVILLMAVWPEPSTGALYGLAVLSTLAGNLLIVGSIANLIVAERAARVGVRLGFADFARAGIAMTLAAMAVAAVWFALGGWMPL